MKTEYKSRNAGCWKMPEIKNDRIDSIANACGLIVLLATALVILLTLPACGSTGWRVSFGVSPVTAIQEAQELKQESIKK